MLFHSGLASGFLQAWVLLQALYHPGLGMVTPPVAETTSNINTSSVHRTPRQVAAAGHLQAKSSPQFPSILDASNTLDSDQQSGPCYVNPYDPPPVDQSFAPFNETLAILYRYRQQQSVNLGSWFVHEQWMTPSLFTCASGNKSSELDIASGWGSTTSARAILERHWDTFINQADFEYLASIGINTVRLPIGYWNLGPYYCQNTPFSAVAEVYQNSWSRIVRAINMAGKAGIGILVDLHGAVGSQNGQQHSGISDGSTNLFSDSSYMDQTIAVLLFLMQQLQNVNNVVGIQILNEPQNNPKLLDFYTRAISSMRQVSPGAETFPLYLHDAFDIKRLSAYIQNRTDFVVQDHHSYFVFTASDEAEPASQHINDVKNDISCSLSTASAHTNRNFIVGEWSCALSPQSLSSEANPSEISKEFCTQQMKTYTDVTSGWSFWSYKTEECEGNPWCFKSAVGKSLPQTFHSYPKKSSSPASSTAPRHLGSSEVLPPSSESDASTFHYHHRPAAIHVRRQAKRDDTCGLAGMQHCEQANAKGYSDGFLTARTFAEKESKLGFVLQYIREFFQPEGMDNCYVQEFSRGLQDGQNAVESSYSP